MAIYMWREETTPPFTPWANTIAYFPLVDDQLDVTGNYTLSLTGTQKSVGYQFYWSELSVDWNYEKVYFINLRVKIDTFGGGITDTGTFINMWGMRYNWYNSNSSYSKIFMMKNGNNADILSTKQSTTTWTWYNMVFGMDSSYNYKAYINWNLVWSGTAPSIREYTNFNVLLFNHQTQATFSQVIVESEPRTDQEVLDYFNATKSDYWL